MLRHFHGAVPEVLHGETGWSRGASEEVVNSIRRRTTSGAEVRLRDVESMAVGVQARALAGPQLGQGGPKINDERGRPRLWR